MSFAYSRSYRGPLKAVIFDWAGTTIDYGCLAPVRSFLQVFRERGVEITSTEARLPMGLAKRDHIRAITRQERVAQAWRVAHGRPADEGDVEAMYTAFVPLQLSRLKEHARLIDGTLDVVAHCRSLGLKIGSTTGYSKEMMAILRPEAERQGFVPDSVVCASDVTEGRPAPFMCFQNAARLGVYPLGAVVKIGDTVADVEEGLNAGMWTIAVTKCGNEIGLSEAEVAALPAAELSERLANAERRLAQAGAHFVVRDITDTMAIVDEIARRVARGERP